MKIARMHRVSFLVVVESQQIRKQKLNRIDRPL